MNIIAYIRVSSEAQSKDGYGLNVQNDSIKKFAYEKGYNLISTFSEEGVSGALEKRPALTKVFDFIKQNKNINGIVFLRLDRLARDLIIQEQLLSEFQKLGVKPISIDEPDLCSKDPSRILFRQMKGAISEYEKSMITLRLSSGRRKKAETTKNYSGGNIPFGFTTKNYQYIQIPEQIEIIKKVFKLRRKPKYGKRMSFNKISQYLNEKYSNIKKFNPMTVHYIANNDFYKGWYSYGDVKVFNSDIKVL